MSSARLKLHLLLATGPDEGLLEYVTARLAEISREQHALAREREILIAAATRLRLGEPPSAVGAVLVKELGA
jgi:hypothetical protein